jgi:hypothetical protein
MGGSEGGREKENYLWAQFGFPGEDVRVEWEEAIIPL